MTNFIKLNLSEVENMPLLDSRTKLLLIILSLSDFNNHILLLPRTRQELIVRLGIPKSTFNCYMSQYQRSGYIKRIGFSEFLINDLYFKRGK